MIYKCSRCEKTFYRKTAKAWVKSFCEKTGQHVRCYRVDKKQNTEINSTAPVSVASESSDHKQFTTPAKGDSW